MGHYDSNREFENQRRSHAPEGREAFTPGHRNVGRVQPKPAGHDAVLRAMQHQERNVTVNLISGEVRKGRIVGGDKFTITVRCADGLRHMLFKHAVEEIVAEEPTNKE
jgi:RNA chaperone Hfq